MEQISTCSGDDEYVMVTRTGEWLVMVVVRVVTSNLRSMAQEVVEKMSSGRFFTVVLSLRMTREVSEEAVVDVTTAVLLLEW